MSANKLITVDLHGLHQAEFGQFITRFYEDFGKTSLSEETDADFKTLFDSLKELIPSYNRSLEQFRATEESKKIAELDKVRDIDFQALRDSIKPYRATKNTTQKNAYEALKIVIDVYKNASKEGYEKETSLISTLVSTLQSDKYAPHVKTLRIGEFVTELEKTNKAFNDVFAHRSFLMLQKETLNSRELRKEMTAIYRKMTKYIETLADVKQDEYYKKVLDVMNNSRKYYADILAVRSGRKGKGEKETLENVK